MDLSHLNDIPLFSGLLPGEMALIVNRLQEREFAEGELVLTRDLPPQELFIILEGRARVELPADEEQVINLTELGPGRLIGERTMLTGQRRTADVRAISLLRAARLSREDFEQLLGEIPTLYANLCRILAGQLGSWAQRHRREESEHRELMSSIIGSRLFPEYDRYPGNSPWVREINQRLATVGASRRDVLIVGEPGTWKDLAARLIHEHSISAGPVLFLDCGAPPVTFTAGESLADPGPAGELALAQQNALFGTASLPDGSSHRSRRGMVEMADGGDLILRHVDRLAPQVQEELASFLKTGEFRRGWDSRARSSRVRIIASSGKPLHLLAQAGQFHPDLYARLSRETVHLLPFRERRKDLPGVARELLRTVCAKHRTKVPRLSQDALNLLVEHDWPLNGTELYQVLSRAVLVCGEGEIHPEHISLQGQQAGEGRFNLLGLPTVERLAHSPTLHGKLRWVSVALFLALLLFLLWGPGEDNPANLAAWTLGWPALVMATFFFARGWCGICPLEAIGSLLGRSGDAVHRRGRRLRSWGAAFSFAGLIAILLLEQGVGMLARPRTTGVLLGGILAATVLGDLLLGRRGWCKFLCPLGRVVGLVARISLLEMHSNHTVCLSRCRVEECVKEKGCPMGLHPSGLDGSDHCVLCMQCLRNCPHRSMQLDLRHPSSGLLGRTRHATGDALLCVTLVAVVLALKGVSLVVGVGGGVERAPLWGLHEYLVALAVLVGYPSLVLAGCLPGRPLRWRRVFASCGLAYLPLAAVGLFMLYFRPLVEYGARLVPELLVLSRLDTLLDPALLTPELGTLRLLFYPLILAAGAFSWHTLGKLRKLDIPATGTFYCQRLLILVTTALFLFVL
ncbi:sigma 54-interacting transcriptional regulator [Geomonas sp.]|uniref:sigma 54-interacting transcriptional regulator n=1 Tax=Geomonas sp. TaxID=2651584 RepID=UPI002B495E8E|nr:sigma 54-interacting transcriptional regulator [Geomonas sp.]HJV33629.1 sigma 54-interacting transcriptional regulator [Geomonas sp.]